VLVASIVATFEFSDVNPAAYIAETLRRRRRDHRRLTR
jgi:hypothetical protein